MYRVAFKFNHKVPNTNKELTIPQNKRALDKKLLYEIIMEKEVIMVKKCKTLIMLTHRWIVKEH